MRIVVTLVAALAALVVAAPATTSATATVAVAITKAGFVPKDVDVTVGDIVIWTNSDTVNRQVVSQQGGFASPILKPTEFYSFTFTKAGKFAYEDPLVKKDRGTVTVAAPPPGQPSVTLGSTPKVVTYGGKVTLTGTVSNGQAGESVTLWATACGGAQTTSKFALATTAGGGFNFQVQPLKNTSYQVKWKNATSGTVTASVRPRVRLGKLTPTRFTVRVFASDSFGGKAVIFQRFNAARGVWTNVRSAILRPNTTGVAPTVISSVTLTSRVKARSRVRVTLPQAQVGGCYLFSRSNVVVT